ncbi:hypothetical protein J6590_013815 [Homalodisca vitripennis]|nr:hypothetical protein J6590_013815 [Homalodisca vitripennis]
MPVLSERYHRAVSGRAVPTTSGAPPHAAPPPSAPIGRRPALNKWPAIITPHVRGETIPLIVSCGNPSLTSTIIAATDFVTIILSEGRSVSPFKTPSGHRFGKTNN